MADPFTALTVCCAALQFLDFGAKFFEKTYQVYKSKDGAVRTVADLEAAAERLKAVAKANGTQQLRPAGATPSENRMAVLCVECDKFADELITSIADLKTNSRRGLRNSAKMVLKADWRKDELRAHGKRLEGLRLEMSDQLLKILGDRQTGVRCALSELQDRDDKMRASISTELERLRTELVSKLHERLLCPQSTIADVQVLLEKTITEAKAASVKHDILASLCYENMDTRRENIAHTHADTYEWMFSTDQDRRRTSHLQAWLRTGGGTFWVSGKPGSGKSTLMKFISSHPHTIELLREWTGDDGHLSTASHFFWIKGNDMQKSQAGLLREMCVAVARQCPGIFDIWRQDASISEDIWPVNAPRVDWKISTLRTMLEALRNCRLHSNGQTIWFAFFIDGLDEYNGDHEELTAILKDLASCNNIKICVASRPWNIFERAFGDADDRKLYMQRLTRLDITTFVQDKIGTDKHFRNLLQEDAAAQDIINDIIARADGVFLWVFLVERQVHRSLVNQDGLQTLRKRILQMPSDLNAYFRHMFDNLDSFYREDTARIFRICMEAMTNVPLLGFAVLNKEDRLAMHIVGPMAVSPANVREAEKRLRSQIYARGQDLIEVYGGTDMKLVSFMHRTVIDFLKLDETHSRLEDWSGDGFDVHQALVEAFLVCSNHISDLTGNPARIDRFPLLAEAAIYHAREIEHTQHRTPFRELARLWQVAQAYPEYLGSEVRDRWMFTRMNLSPLTPYAVAHGLAIFLRRRAADGHPELSRQYPNDPLLGYATIKTMRARAAHPPSTDMIGTLLRLGSSPNTPNEYWVDVPTEALDTTVTPPTRKAQGSVYVLLLQELYHSPLPVLHEYLQICEMFIAAAGPVADTHLQDQKAALGELFGMPISEQEILQHVFGKRQADRLVALRPLSPDNVFVGVTAKATQQRKRGVFDSFLSMFRG